MILGKEVRYERMRRWRCNRRADEVFNLGAPVAAACV